MTPDKKSIFREIAKGLPPAQQTEFWEMAAHLEKLSPDDEILRVCQAMGVLTLITQKIPVELAVQRDGVAGNMHNFQKRATRDAPESTGAIHRHD